MINNNVLRGCHGKDQWVTAVQIKVFIQGV